MDFLLLQINDSSFPIGSYTHSFGLESYVQMGYVTSKIEALSYIKSVLNTQILYTDLLAIKLIYMKGDLKEIMKIESLICAATPASEARQGMQKLGKRFLKTVQSMGLAYNENFHKYVMSSRHTTHASAYGAFCLYYAIDFEMALKYYLYSQTSSILTNCVKLIPLSQYDGQNILTSLHKELESLFIKLQNLGEDDLCNASIHNDIKAMQHEFLHSRLYMS